VTDMKIYLSFGREEKEGYEKKNVADLPQLQDESVEEIQALEVIEKVGSLIDFICECYRVLKPEGKAIFTSQYYTSIGAWKHPANRRGISEQSLNFADKNWREANNFYCGSLKDCDFEVIGSFAMEQDLMARADDARAFWMRRYCNVVQAIMFTLTKKKNG